MQYTLEVILQDYKPKNWREIVVSWDKTFEELCNIIISLYWLDKDHLWEYRIGDDFFINSPEFGDIDDKTIDKFEDKKFGDLQWLSLNHNGGKYKLHEHFSSDKNYKNAVLYYDFWDNRVFDVKLKSSKDTDQWSDREVIDGDGYYLISDIGGVEWLNELVEEYKKKTINPDLFESREDFEEYIKPALKKFSI